MPIDRSALFSALAELENLNNEVAQLQATLAKKMAAAKVAEQRVDALLGNAPQAPAKRGPGRPRKNPVAAEAAPVAKRGPGRPRKTPAAADAAPVAKRGPGRPRKNPVATDAAPVAKRGPGRPRKNPVATDAAPVAKRGPGRPRKNPVAPDAAPVAKRGPGRPRKNPVATDAAPVAKRGPGRPRKNPVAPDAAPVAKRGPGRPRKNPVAPDAAPVAKRGPGRPRKTVEGMEVKAGATVLRAPAATEGPRARLIAALEHVSAADITDLARLAYGATGAVEKHRARALAAELRKLGKLSRDEDGLYRPIR